jgi:hypothetical protein
MKKTNLTCEEALAKIPSAYKRMEIVDGKAEVCLSKEGVRMLVEMSNKPKAYKRKFLKWLETVCKN